MQNEPSEGGLRFDIAVERWISLPENFREFWRQRAEEEHRAATTEMGRILARRDMEGYPPYLEDEIRQSWREAQLLNGWVKGKYMCFGFPRHDRSAIERVKIHTDLRYELRFEQDQAFDLEYRETSGQRGLLYINALFYRVEPVRDAQDAARRGRAPAPYWDEAKREGRCWLDDNGYPVPGDGNQARMEQHIATWLAERGHEASEASVRRHVTAWIAEYRAEIGAG